MAKANVLREIRGIKSEVVFIKSFFRTGDFKQLATTMPDDNSCVRIVWLQASFDHVSGSFANDKTPALIPFGMIELRGKLPSLRDVPRLSPLHSIPLSEVSCPRLRLIVGH